MLAIVIMLETGDVSRLAQAGNFASYARCVDSARYSNGKKKGEGSIRNGNDHLVWAFIQVASFVCRFNEEAGRFFERNKARTNEVVATQALAHKLARASYHVLKTKHPFDVNRCFV